MIDKNWKSHIHGKPTPAPRIKFIFAWYDLWIGAFWDKKGFLYLFPIPMIGIKIDFRKGTEIERYCRDIRG